MKTLITLAFVTLFSIQAHAGPVADYLNGHKSAEEISQSLIAQPEKFEERLKELAAEATVENKTSKDHLDLLELEREINRAAIEYNTKVRNQNKWIRIGGVAVGAVAGALVGGAYGHFKFATKHSPGTDPFDSMIKKSATILEGTLIIGVSVVGTSAGSIVGYVISDYGFTKTELNLNNKLLD